MQITQEEFYGRCYEFDTGSTVQATQRVLGYYMTTPGTLTLPKATPDFLGNAIWVINDRGSQITIRDFGGTIAALLSDQKAAVAYLRAADTDDGTWDFAFLNLV